MLITCQQMQNNESTMSVVREGISPSLEGQKELVNIVRKKQLRKEVNLLRKIADKFFSLKDSGYIKRHITDESKDTDTCSNSYSENSSLYNYSYMETSTAFHDEKMRSTIVSDEDINHVEDDESNGLASTTTQGIECDTPLPYIIIQDFEKDEECYEVSPCKKINLVRCHDNTDKSFKKKKQSIKFTSISIIAPSPFKTTKQMRYNDFSIEKLIPRRFKNPDIFTYLMKGKKIKVKQFHYSDTKGNNNHLIAIEAELDSLKISLASEKEKNSVLNTEVHSLQERNNYIDMLHDEERRRAEQAYSIELNKQKALVESLISQNQLLSTGLTGIKSMQKPTKLQLESLEKEHKALRESSQKFQDEKSSEIANIYKTIVEPLKKEIITKDYEMRLLNDKLVLTQDSLHDLESKQKIITENMCAKIEELKKVKDELQTLKVDFARKQELAESRFVNDKNTLPDNKSGHDSKQKKYSLPSKREISYALSTYNWKVIDLEYIANKALCFHFRLPIGSEPIINDDTLKVYQINEFNDIHHCYWYATLTVNEQSWDPSSPDQEFVIAGDSVGKRSGKIVYRSEEAACDALLFFVLHEIDPCGEWVDEIMQTHEVACLLRKHSSRKGTRWMALIKKQNQTFLADVRDAGKYKKPTLISDRRSVKYIEN